MITTFGEVSYDTDANANTKKKESQKDLWLRLKNGDNEVRILTAPFQYLVHTYKKDPTNKKDFGTKIKCSALHKQCPLCDMGDKAKQRWYYGVIDRATGTYKILDVSWAIFNHIQKMARNPKIGDPTKYDINIIKDENAASPAQWYTCQNLSKEPLSATDQQIKDRDVDLDFLKAKCTPLEPSVVQKILDKINGVATPAGDVKGNGKAKAAPKAPAVSMVDDEDLSDTFPAYDGEQA